MNSTHILLRVFPLRRHAAPDRIPRADLWTAGPRALFCAAIALTAILWAACVSPVWAGGDPAGLPPEIRAHFSDEEVARHDAYMRGRYWLFAAGTALRIAALALLVFTPASAALRGAVVRLAPARPGLAVALYLAALLLVFELLMLPLGYYAGFVREHAYGLSTQTAPEWLLDRLKGAGLALALGVPLGSLLVWLWRRAPGRWVFPAWVLGGSVALALVALAPVVIDPLFHTIRPLQDAALRERVLILAQRAGITAEQVYEADASRRTRKGNAYFTGLGTTKRIVLYDTLVARSDPDAVELVVAHEMGHWVHAHIWQGLGLSVLGMGVLLWCGARMLAWAAERRAFRLAGPADVAGVPLLLLTMLLLNLISLPAQHAVSRHFERQADRASLELTGNPEAFVRAEVDLARSNLADLRPPAPIVWLLYTHPPVAERIRMADSFAAHRAAPRPRSD